MRWPWQRRHQEPAHLRAGRWGERVASRALKKKGYRIIGRRVRVGKRDELDLVMRKGSLLVFVEVKTRASESFARPALAVDRRKQHRLSRAAVRYLNRMRRRPETFRFDVVEVIGEEGKEPPIVRHIEEAFPLDHRYRVSW